MWSSWSPHPDQGEAGPLWTGSWPLCDPTPRGAGGDKSQKTLRTCPGCKRGHLQEDLCVVKLIQGLPGWRASHTQ
ncbi:hypothetical protein LEMLEM_LOCUS5198 [Lemmus lemmus]